jgi:hypothetical protein
VVHFFSPTATDAIRAERGISKLRLPPNAFSARRAVRLDLPRSPYFFAARSHTASEMKKGSQTSTPPRGYFQNFFLLSPALPHVLALVGVIGLSGASVKRLIDSRNRSAFTSVSSLPSASRFCSGVINRGSRFVSRTFVSRSVSRKDMTLVPMVPSTANFAERSH